MTNVTVKFLIYRADMLLDEEIETFNDITFEELDAEMQSYKERRFDALFDDYLTFLVQNNLYVASREDKYKMAFESVYWGDWEIIE